MRPPVPPPVPPAVPPPPDDGLARGTSDGLPVVVRQPSRPRRSGHGPLVAVVLLLAATALAIAAVVAWPTNRGRREERVAARTTDPVAMPEPVAPPEPAPPEQPAPAAPVAAAPSRTPDRMQEAEVVGTEPPRADAAAALQAETDRERAERDRRATAAVERALAATLAALRSGDLAAARQSADAADSAVGDDAALRDRTARWRLLVDYAAQLDTHRQQADASAAKGREYEIDGRIVGIVELTPETFAYKTAGRTKRGPRSALPRAIARAILADWFAGDGRAANHIFLGLDRLLEPRPDLAAVRGEWDTALRGEPATASLMPLLDDPLVVDQARQ